MTDEPVLRQLSALTTLVRSDTLQSADFGVTARHLTEAAARTLGVARVSLWRYDESRTKIRCLDLYEAGPGRHSAGVEWLVADSPRYFMALAASDVIAADDAREDARTSELSAGYLARLGVTSLMDVPIYVAGRVEGVLCHQHVGPPRRWTPEDQLFAVALANVASLALGQWLHREAEARLKESQRRYQELVDSLDGIVWEADAETFRFTFVSPQAERLLGYPPARFLADLTWRDVIHPDDYDQVISFCTKAVRERRNHELEYRMLTADGRVVWVRDLATVIVERGRPVKLCGVLLMINERKELEAQLLQAQKMEAVGKLAGGVAHDFNNLLTIINGYSHLLLSRLAVNDPLRPDVEEIKQAGDRAAALTQQLLAFSRRQVLIPSVLDLNAVVSGMSSMVQRLLGEDIDLSTALAPALGHVRADRSQLEQVIMNLAVNARDAMPQGGKLTIETANVDIDDSFRHGQVVAPGRYVLLAVSDTGQGMDEETKARVFEPFFTTKGLGKGTGLGLSTVYGIVRQSGGYIFVYSEPGKGSTFKIYLPRVDEAVEPEPAALADPGLPRGNETILLVEDEPGVRMLVRDTLELQGYTVLEARHGIEALVLSSRHPGPVHLLLTDVVMPQMSGREVAAQLLAARPDVKVLYMSGYAENSVVHHGILDPGTAFLQKPFTPDVLVRRVREVLDGAGPRGEAR
ncbi:ATP-binding protein [Nitrospira sp. Kam-Ns4a]